MSEELHILARKFAELYDDLDRKQLRFNDIVETAKQFYINPIDGIYELINSCRKDDVLYVKKQPMWEVLNRDYRWMLSNE